MGPAWLSGKVFDLLSRVLGSSCTVSSGFFRGSVFGQDNSEPSLVLVKPRKDMNNVSRRRDMTEILLKAAQNTIQSTVVNTPACSQSCKGNQSTCRENHNIDLDKSGQSWC